MYKDMHLMVFQRGVGISIMALDENWQLCMALCFDEPWIWAIFPRANKDLGPVTVS